MKNLTIVMYHYVRNLKNNGCKFALTTKVDIAFTTNIGDDAFMFPRVDTNDITTKETYKRMTGNRVNDN